MDQVAVIAGVISLGQAALAEPGCNTWNTGADLGARNRHDHTPLHRAAWSDHAEAIAALIAAGADAGARDERGRTTFDLIPDDSPLVGTSACCRLNDARV